MSDRDSQSPVLGGNMWDREYSVEGYVYGEAPNDFPRAMTAKLKRGRVLCLAEGEGRNAVHLARHGFAATGVDSSAVGLEKAHRLARKHGVEITTIHTEELIREVVEGVNLTGRASVVQVLARKA